MTDRRMRTTADGPVVISEKTLRALLAIRRQKLLASLYGQVVIAQSNFDALADIWAEPARPDWLTVHADQPQVDLPPRIAGAAPCDAAALRLALGIGASLVLIEGPIKERAKLSFIKCQGTISILVLAHREGLLSAVQPMVKALQKLGHGDVIPPPEQLAALWQALDNLEEA